MGRYVDNINRNGIQYDIEGSVRVDKYETDTAELAVSDEEGNVIIEVSEEGDIKTKSFDSRYIPSSNGNDDSDLKISDINGNAIAVFKDGGIETKTIKNFKIELLIENGCIDNNGVNQYIYSSYNDGKRSAFFINVSNTNEMIADRDMLIYKYNSLHEFLYVTMTTQNTKSDLTDCSYIRFMFRTGDVVNSKITCKFNGTGCPVEEKLVAMRTPSERLLYHVDGEMYTTALLMLPPNYSPCGKKVPLVLWDSGDGSFVNWNTHEMGGESTKRRIGLEYMRDQGFAVVEIYSWGSYYYNKYSGCGNRSAMPIPTHLKTHEKGVEYVCSRYNIDADNIFHLSKSGSGKIALSYAIEKPNFNLKHIYAFAPVFDDLNFGRWGMSDYRKALYEELNLVGTTEQVEQFRDGYEGDTQHHGWLLTREPYSGTITQEELEHLHEINQDFVRQNYAQFSKISVNWKNLVGQSPDEKFQDTLDWGYKFWVTDRPNWADHESPDAQGNYPIYNRNTDIYNKHNLTMIGGNIPIKVIMAKNDEQTPYWSCLEVVNQLRNGGCDATIYPLTSGGHSAPDMGTVEQATNVTTLCGQTYEEVSVGWYMACEDIQKRYLSHIDKDVYDYINQTPE